MNDQIDELIRHAPRSGASADFTARVMARVRAESTPRAGFAWRPALAFAALVVVSILSGIAFEKQREARRLEAIRIEARQLEAELEALKKQSQKSSEVYLGGDATREYVLDLRDLTAPSSQVQPVSQSF